MHLIDSNIAFLPVNERKNILLIISINQLVLIMWVEHNMFNELAMVVQKGNIENSFVQHQEHNSQKSIFYSN